MARRGKLAGGLLAAMLGGSDPLSEGPRTGPTDPRSVLELLSHDIPFRTEPAVGVVFPPEVGDAE